MVAPTGSTKWTTVVSYHVDAERCGVARLSQQLARRLGLPVVALRDYDGSGRPLFSLKWSEIKHDATAAAHLMRVCDNGDQLWHDEEGYAHHAWSAEIVLPLFQVGVPALVESVAMANSALFTFGMGSKIDLDRFVVVRDHFPAQQLWISSADHEGSAPSRVPDLMALWGEGARNLGHLSDAALALVWPRCRAMVAFFAHGLRANNTSVHAALDAGVPVITNHGPDTPPDLLDRTVDYRYLSTHHWPVTTGSPYTWERLLRHLGCGPTTEGGRCA